MYELCTCVFKEKDGFNKAKSSMRSLFSSSLRHLVLVLSFLPAILRRLLHSSLSLSLSAQLSSIHLSSAHRPSEQAPSTQGGRRGRCSGRIDGYEAQGTLRPQLPAHPVFNHKVHMLITFSVSSPLMILASSGCGFLVHLSSSCAACSMQCSSFFSPICWESNAP